MTYKENLRIKEKNVYELPKTGKMLVPGIIFASPSLIDSVEEECLKQVANVAQLQGIIGKSIGMSDIHSGYGFPIGGVAAFDMKKGIVSPGGVGYDINCGVRILTTNIPSEAFEKKKKKILKQIKNAIPSGLGKGNENKISEEELNRVLIEGARWAIEKGFGVKEDLENCEENGEMKPANPKDVSQRAKARGKPQLGTLGSGNHFLEILKVDEIFNDKIAKIFGLEKNNVLIMIHCGSRGLGHQVASDYIQLMEKEFGIKNLPDRELVNAPITSNLGQKYFSAMNCAINFAFANRQIIMHKIRKIIEREFPKNKAELLYDVCHNIAKIEEHEIDGKKQEVCIHRKGATRSFGPGRKEIPKRYRKVGQPVIIPGSMGTASYVLVGTKKAEEISFGSTAHGAGRLLSRSQAIKTMQGETIKKELNAKGISVETDSVKSLAEEAPQSYKDIENVIKVSDELGLAKKVARLIPIGVIKG
jgi:tRNA-splicing ligase RtcB